MKKIHLSMLTFATLAEQVNQPSTEVGLRTNSLHFRYVCIDELSWPRHEHNIWQVNPKSISVSFGWGPPINNRGVFNFHARMIFQQLEKLWQLTAMFNTLKCLLGLSSTPDSQPVTNPNPLAPLYNHGQSYPQPGNYMYWNGLPNHQGIIFATVGLQSSYVT